MLTALSALNLETNALSVLLVATFSLILSSGSALLNSTAIQSPIHANLAILLARLVISQLMTALAAYRPNLTSSTL